MSLQFTKSASLPAEARLQNSAANCSTIGLCCVTITWQQIFEDALQVTVVRVLPNVTIEHRQFGRKCETVTADRGKPRRFIMLMAEKLPVAPTYFVWLF